jgi:hypothetical protein
VPQQTPLLKEYWKKSLQHMPRAEVQKNLKELGFTFSTNNLSDAEIRKLLYGLLAQLEEPIQIETIQLLQGSRS